jgi:hypothetical protein
MKNNNEYRSIISIEDEPIISIEEQNIIIEWTEKNFNRFIKTGFNRQMINLDLVPDFPNIVNNIKKRIEEKENLNKYSQEPNIRDAIGYMSNGGKLPMHKDPNQNNNSLIHVRYNIYVQIPFKGGYPIYNNQLIQLKERNYICCRSGLDEHCCQKVEGDRARIVLSFGYLVPLKDIDEIHIKYSVD